MPALGGNRCTWREVFAFLALCCGSPQLQKQQWFLLSCRASRTCGSLLLITAGNAWNSEKGGWKPYQLDFKEGSQSQNLRPRVSSELKGTCASLPACAAWQLRIAAHRERLVWTNSSPLLRVRGLHIFTGQGKGNVLRKQSFFQLLHWKGTRTKGHCLLRLTIPSSLWIKRILGRPRTPGAQTQNPGETWFFPWLLTREISEDTGREG